MGNVDQVTLKMRCFFSPGKVQPLQSQFSSCRSKTLTFLLCDEVLDNDVGHAVSVGVAVLVEAVNRAENQPVAGDGPILAAQHLDRR